MKRTLTHWRADPDLAGLRDQDALGKLPPAERQDCRTLWGDIDVLLKRAQDLKESKGDDTTGQRQALPWHSSRKRSLMQGAPKVS